MFRLSDYDFEYSEKDYVAFMSLFKKFVYMIREVTTEMVYEDELFNEAENLALEYIEMRQNKTVGDELKAFITEAVNYLGYPCVILDGKTTEEIDDLLWNIFEDLGYLVS